MMEKILTKINPIIKIFFIILQLIFLTLSQKTVSILPIFVPFFLVNFSCYSLIKKSFKTILNISPLLFSFFFIGFLFGNKLQYDIYLTITIATFAVYSFNVINNLNSFRLLASLKTLTPKNARGIFIIFFYGLVYFFYSLKRIIQTTKSTYKLETGVRANINSTITLFSSVFGKAINKTQEKKSTIALLTQNLSNTNFSKIDFLPLLILTIQLIILFL